MAEAKKYILRPADTGNFKIAYDKELNPMQWEVVRHADGSSLVLAGAGSGKTRTLIYRVLYLIEKGVPANNILLVTFTNRAANEMRQRMEKALGGDLKGMWCGTFHHIGHRILRRFASRMGLGENFGILDEEDSKMLLKNCYSILSFKTSEVRFPQASVVHRIISMSANTRESLAQTIDRKYPQLFHWTAEINALAEEYTRRKQASQLLDFDDLILYWIRLMREHPDVHEQLAGQFRYCLVDEYQDINPLQNEVIELLSSKHANLLVVGDDAQSIYSFRGADIQTILDFPKRHDPTNIFKLETNYRSTPEILAMANRSISNNLNQYHKELKSVTDSHALPRLIRVRDVRDQARYVTQRIMELNEEGVPLHRIAVLFRARYQAAELELQLAKSQMPYILRGGVRFFEQAHIKDVVAHLKIVHHPEDELAWARVLTMYPGIGPGTAQKMHAKYLELSRAGQGAGVLTQEVFYESAPKRSRESLRGLRLLMGKLIDPKNTAHPDLLVRYILDSGYVKILETRFDNPKDRMEDLTELANFAHTYKDVNDFLTDIALRENFRGESFSAEGAGARFEGEHPLVLSTIHQAKGLEWHAVIILSLAEGQFPHHQALGDERAMEEERRLFYVAVTRAEKELEMIHPMTRYDHNQGLVIARTSPYVDELPDTTYETVEAIDENAQDDPWDPFEESYSVDR